MRRLFFGLILCASAIASTSQPLVGTTGTGAFFTNTGTTYFAFSLGAGPAFVPSASPSGYYALMPTSGVLRNMCFYLATLPASGKTWTFSLYKNGAVPSGAPSVVVNSSSSNLTCDTADILRFAAGDLICIQSVAAATPASSLGSWYVTMVPDIPGETILFTGSPGASAASFYMLGAAEQTNGTESNEAWPAACGGTVEKLYAQSVTASGSGKSWVFTFDLNSTGQSLAVTAANTATVQSDTNPAHNVTVTAGNTLSMHLTIPLGTPASSDVYASVVFLPNTLGNFLIPAARNGAPSNSVNNYAGLIGRAPSWTATETSVQQIFPNMQMQAFYVTATTALTTGSYALTLNDNTVSTAVTVTINASSSYPVHVTGQTVAIKSTDLIDVLSAPATSPSTPGTFLWSFLGYIAPTDSHFFSVLE